MGQRHARCKEPKVRCGALMGDWDGNESFSNPSLTSGVETLSTKKTASDIGSAYDGSLLELFHGFNTEYGQVNLNQTIITLAASIFETLSMDHHVLFISNKIFDEEYAADETFKQQFMKHLKKSCLKYPMFIRDYDADTWLVLHNIYFLRMHKFVLTMFEDGRDEKSYEILNLLALYHVIMDITPNQFKIFSVRFLRFLAYLSMVTEEQLPTFIHYTVNITNVICSAVEKYQKRMKLLINNTDQFNYPARENYRELKKFKQIVINLRRSLEKPLNELHKQVMLKRQKVSKSIVHEFEQNCAFRALKRGYKFKKREKTEEQTNEKDVKKHKIKYLTKDFESIDE